MAVGPVASAQDVTPVQLDSDIVDHDKVDGRRWERFLFDPLASGVHTIRFSLDGDADIRFSIFEVSSGNRVATTYRSATPGTWTGELDASEQYSVGVWAVSGSASYTATIEPFEPVTPVNSGKDKDKNNDVEETGSGGFDSDEAIFTSARTWNAAGEVHRVLAVGNTLYVGGDFTEIYGPGGKKLKRNYLAAFNRSTGEPTDFAPELDNNVRALALSPDEKTLYVGGAFIKVDGRSRKRVAAFDVRSGALTSFDSPGPNSALRAIVVTDERVYLGGLFTSIGGRDRKHVAAVDPATGALDPSFIASPGDNVKALVAGPEGLWIGGDFSRVNGVQRRGLGLVDLVDGSLKPSDDVTAEVIDLAASNDQLFVAVGGPGGRAAAFDRATGKEQWTIASDGNFQAVDVDTGRYVYFGGHYEIVEGNRDADRMTRHDKRTGKMDVSWLPLVNGIRSVNAVDVTPDGLYIGGDFSRVDLKPQEGFAIFPGLTR